MRPKTAAHRGRDRRRPDPRGFHSGDRSHHAHPTSGETPIEQRDPDASGDACSGTPAERRDGRSGTAELKDEGDHEQRAEWLPQEHDPHRPGTLRGDPPDEVGGTVCDGGPDAE